MTNACRDSHGYRLLRGASRSSPGTTPTMVHWRLPRRFSTTPPSWVASIGEGIRGASHGEDSLVFTVWSSPEPAVDGTGRGGCLARVWPAYLERWC